MAVRKGGKKGRKVGRGSRSPGHKAYTSNNRCAANKARRAKALARHLAVAAATGTAGVAGRARRAARLAAAIQRPPVTVEA